MKWSSDEREAFLRNLSVLAETLGETVTAGRLVGYAVALDEVDAACVMCGLEEAMRECKFFPKPVELRDLGQASKKWRREQERRWDANQEQRQKSLEPPLSNEQLQANIDRLREVVKGLSSKRRMR